MNYELRITKNSKINLAEWKSVAVEFGIMLMEPHHSTSAQFGKTISIRNNDGDGLMMYGMAKMLRLNYSNGEIRFIRPDDLESPNSESKSKLIELASKLGAKISDSKGQEYK